MLWVPVVKMISGQVVLTGSDFPYVPEWKLAAGIGLHMEKWGANLDATYTSHQYGTAKNLDEPVTSSREGKIDSAFVVDLSGYYKIDDNWKLIGGCEQSL